MSAGIPITIEFGYVIERGRRSQIPNIPSSHQRWCRESIRKQEEARGGFK